MLSIISLVLSIISMIISLYFSLSSAIKARINKFNDNIAEIDKIIIQDPRLLAVCDESEIEKRKDDTEFIAKLEALICFHFNIFENAYIQFLSSKLTLFRSLKRAWHNFIITLFKSQLAKNLWDKNKYLYDDKFVLYITKLIDPH